MEAKYPIFKIIYKTAYEDKLTSIISAESMTRAKSLLEAYLLSLNTVGFEPQFVINTIYNSDREGIILFR